MCMHTATYCMQTPKWWWFLFLWGRRPLRGRLGGPETSLYCGLIQRPENMVLLSPCSAKDYLGHPNSEPSRVQGASWASPRSAGSRLWASKMMFQGLRGANNCHSGDMQVSPEMTSNFYLKWTKLQFPSVPSWIICTISGKITLKEKGQTCMLL